MRRHLLTTLAGLTVFGLTAAAQAAFITGTQGLAVLSSISSAPTSSLATATSFSGIELTTTAGQTGDFDPFPSVHTFGAVTLDTATVSPGTPFTFGDALFGTFTGTSILDGGYNALTRSRSFVLTGTLSPGSSFSGLITNSASLSLSFTQAGGPGTAYSLSGTLITPAIGVPEPTTIVLLGTFCAPAAAIGWLRRRRSEPAQRV
ncbi:MAG: PEP-CTERM sorting domain-containing protein [Planctomycetaceae bacterium]